MTEFSTPTVLSGEPLPLTENYMLLPVEQSFDWQGYFASIDSGQWYLVVFRSKHRPDADEDLLNDLDRQASEVARQTPGFICYFIGTPRVTGECLSFCLWQDRASAQSGASHAAHRRAIDLGMDAFEHYVLERYAIRKFNRNEPVKFWRL